MLQLSAIILTYALGSTAAAANTEDLPTLYSGVMSVPHFMSVSSLPGPAALYATSSMPSTNADSASISAPSTASESGSELMPRTSSTSLRESFLLYGLPGLLLLSTVLIIVIRVNRQLSSEITRRMELEQQLRSSEYHYRGMVESLSAIAWEANPEDYCYNYVSPQAESLLGYPLHQWKEPGFWQSIVHPQDLQKTEALCREAASSGNDHSVDYRVISADGRTLWIRDIVSLIKQGRKSVMRGLMIDISGTKQTEEAL